VGESTEDLLSGLKAGTRTLVLRVPVVSVAMEDGKNEWCFAPEEEDLREMERLGEILSRWEEAVAPAMRVLHPDREGEILELFRIVRAKLLLNRPNKYFFGYFRPGGSSDDGRDFYLTTFDRTLSHLAGLARKTAEDSPEGSASGPFKGP